MKFKRDEKDIGCLVDNVFSEWLEVASQDLNLTDQQSKDIILDFYLQYTKDNCKIKEKDEKLYYITFINKFETYINDSLLNTKKR